MTAQIDKRPAAIRVVLPVCVPPLAEAAAALSSAATAAGFIGSTIADLLMPVCFRPARWSTR